MAISTKSAMHVSSGILKLGGYDQDENGEGGGEWESGLGWIDVALMVRRISTLDVVRFRLQAEF